MGEFVFNHLLWYVDTFGIHISICFPRLLSGFIVSQHSTFLSPSNFAGPTPKVIFFSMRLFQGSHVSDVHAYFCASSKGFPSSSAEGPVVGHYLVLPATLVNRMFQALIDESRFLTHQISELSDRRSG
ncbi:hypothetical protein IC582_026513 [Cucumis melo]